MAALRTLFGVKELGFQDEELGLLGVDAHRPFPYKLSQGLGCALEFARGVIEFGPVPRLGLQFGPQGGNHRIAGVAFVGLRMAIEEQLQLVHGGAGVALIEGDRGGQAVAAQGGLVLGFFRAVRRGEGL